jgi:NADH-quinone oxidoreductase subunit J
MVLFLFVIMLLGTEKGKPGEPVGFIRVFGGLVTLVVLAEAMFMIFVKNPSNLMVAVPEADTATAQAIGTVLFDQYLLPFEITSFILLIAVIGAIVLTKTEKKKSPLPGTGGEGK